MSTKFEFNGKKLFEQPSVEVVPLSLGNILTSSNNTPELGFDEVD